jgi:sugar lactone lactonase YvrE
LTKRERFYILLTMIKSFTRLPLFVISLLFIVGCNDVSTSQRQANIPKAAFEINYTAAAHDLRIKSINVTPQVAGQNITPYAGVFQVGNAVFDGSAITAPVYITNNDSSDWTGVEMQAYNLTFGSATVCDADLGTGWLTSAPAYGAWGWLFTSGTSGSEFTIPSAGQSITRAIGFNATSDFVGVVYIYANVPVITGIDQVSALTGSTITLSGYNFSTTPGSVTFNGVAATVQTWTDTYITVTVPATTTLGNIIIDTVDSNTPYSNPILFTPYSVLVNDPSLSTINAPIGITTDTSGNLYVANYSNNNILEVTPLGVISTYSDDPNALLSGPADVAFSPEGMLYVANSGGNNVIAVPGGAAPASVFTGTGSAPVALAFSDDGQAWPLFVVNSGDGTITSVTSAGTATQFASGFGLPNAIATDSAGNVYVGDCSDGSIYEINAAGTLTTTVVSGLTCPAGIKFDTNGNMFILDSGTAMLYKYNPNIVCGSKLSVFAQDISTNGDAEFVFSPDHSVISMTQDTPVNGIITIPLQ